MIKSLSKAAQLFQKLAEEGISWGFLDSSRGKNIIARPPGYFIEKLSEEERKLINELKSEEVSFLGRPKMERKP